MREQFRFDLTGGAVTVSGNYRPDTNGTPVNFQLSDGRFLADFSLNEPGDPEPLIAFPSFLVERPTWIFSKRDVGVRGGASDCTTDPRMARTGRGGQLCEVSSPPARAINAAGRRETDSTGWRQASRYYS
ncbi:MAG: hypothetical protein U0361_05100 [Nitrospiraceae bacterium]